MKGWARDWLTVRLEEGLAAEAAPAGRGREEEKKRGVKEEGAGLGGGEGWAEDRRAERSRGNMLGGCTLV